MLDDNGGYDPKIRFAIFIICVIIAGYYCYKGFSRTTSRNVMLFTLLTFIGTVFLSLYTFVLSETPGWGLVSLILGAIPMCFALILYMRLKKEAR